MSENFSLSTQFEIGSIKIDGNDVIGLFNSISIYENINSPLVTGTIVLLETDKNQFVTNMILKVVRILNLNLLMLMVSNSNSRGF